MRRGLLLIAGMAFIGLCADAYAQDIQPIPEEAAKGGRRLCTQADLSGTNFRTGHAFQMVDFNETPPLGESQFIREFPYNYLIFYPNWHYASLSIDRQVKTIAWLQKYVSRAPDATRIYTLSKDGVLEIIQNDRVVYTYRCVAVLQAKDDFQVGDLILTGYTHKHRSELYKLFRRWY